LLYLSAEIREIQNNSLGLNFFCFLFEYFLFLISIKIYNSKKKANHKSFNKFSIRETIIWVSNPENKKKIIMSTGILIQTVLFALVEQKKNMRVGKRKFSILFQKYYIIELK
jgi:hypothetical protein